MIIPRLDPDSGPLEAAVAYAGDGWRVGPTEPGEKRPAASLGRRWQTRTSTDPAALTAMFAGCREGTGVFLHAGASGAVIIDVDHPDKLPKVLADALPLAPYQSTRPDSPGRGHYVFAQPPGRMIGNSVGQLSNGWGEVRGTNGLIVVEPSVHSDGGRYRWERWGPVPELPADIADLLPDSLDVADAVSPAAVRTFLDAHTTEARPELLEVRVAAISKALARGESRHDTFRDHVTGGLKEAAAGLLDAKTVVDTLETLFLPAVLTPLPNRHQRTAASARQEWRDILAWAVPQAIAAEPEEVRARSQDQVPPLFEEVDGPDTSDGSYGDVREPRYADLSWLLTGRRPVKPSPTVCTRTDGHGLFYRGAVNVLFGDPETGKSWIAYAAGVEQLTAGKRVAILDLDHNGVEAIVGRLLDLGADPATLADPDRFRVYEPDGDLAAIVAELIGWQVGYVVVDSVGELLPMLGLSSGSPDDFTIANAKVMVPLARAGACVVIIDHLAKAAISRAIGPTGTVAKGRTVSGASLRVSLAGPPFAPGIGGRARLTIKKDRNGGLRQACPPAAGRGGDQLAGLFVLEPRVSGGVAWQVTAPTEESARAADRVAEDVAEVDGLDPGDRESVMKVKAALGWGSNRATAALKEWRALNDS